jgi:hypothetical protein
MKENWEDYFKQKSDRDLYNIISESEDASFDTKNEAKKELERREFDFKNIERIKLSWELEDLINEIKYENTGLFRDEYNIVFQRIYVLGLLLLPFIGIFLLVKNLQGEAGNSVSYFGAIILIIFPPLIAYFQNKKLVKMKSHAQKRDNRIKEITKLLIKE